MTDGDSDEKFDKGQLKQTIGGQQSHESEYGEQGDQAADTSDEEIIRKEAFGGSGAQPIGGNDSRTGSGTPLTSGYGGGGGDSSTAGAGVGAPGGQAQPGEGSAPPRSMGTRGAEFGQFGDHDDRGQQGQSGTGQADLGSQAGSTLSGHADQQELGEGGGEVDQPGSYTRGEGFILQQEGSASSAKATEGADFVAEGRGAPEEEEDEASSEGGVG